MDAIIADIHGNLEALQSVLGAIGDLHPSRIISLGDLIGYGPDSIECVRRSKEWDISILGEWDATLLEFHPEKWNPTLSRHIENLRSEFQSDAESKSLMTTIESLLPQWIESGIHFTHATPHNIREWIFPEDTYDPKKLNRIAEQFDDVCICGHAHINGVYRRTESLDWEFIQPKPGVEYEIRSASKTIVTVGSVGQPRDEDPRASFVTLDNDHVTFHRVDYDFESTAEKIRSNPKLENMFGERLSFGR